MQFIGCDVSPFIGSGMPNSTWTEAYVTSCEGPGVIVAGTTGTWNNLAMFIPATAPSRLAGCGIINVHYILEASRTFVSLPVVCLVLFSRSF